jgi:hypothetical protein
VSIDVNLITDTATIAKGPKISREKPRNFRTKGMHRKAVKRKKTCGSDVIDQ